MMREGNDFSGKYEPLELKFFVCRVRGGPVGRAHRATTRGRDGLPRVRLRRVPTFRVENITPEVKT